MTKPQSSLGGWSQATDLERRGILPLCDITKSRFHHSTHTWRGSRKDDLCVTVRNLHNAETFGNNNDGGGGSIFTNYLANVCSG